MYLREEISGLKLQVTEHQAHNDRNQDIRSDQAFKIGDLQKNVKELEDRVKNLELQNSKLLDDNASLKKSLENAKSHDKSKVLETGEVKKVVSTYVNDRTKKWLADSINKI